TNAAWYLVPTNMPDQARGRAGKSSLLPFRITSLPCSVAPQQGQALTSTSKGANPTGSPLQRLRRVASRADVDSDRGLSRQIVSDRCSITCWLFRLAMV